MSCDRCFDPHTGDHPHDHGYDLPDVRETFDLWGPCGACPASAKPCTCAAGDGEYCAACIEDYCDDCYGDREAPTGERVTVTIVRGYAACPCGSGEGVLSRVSYQVEGPGTTVTVPQSTDTAALVKAIWPTARPPEVDHAWESERGLREMGG